MSERNTNKMVAVAIVVAVVTAFMAGLFMFSIGTWDMEKNTTLMQIRGHPFMPECPIVFPIAETRSPRALPYMM